MFSLGSKKANDCQSILDPQDLAVVVGKRAPYRRSDPGTEIDLRGSMTVGRAPESESATEYELCGKLPRAFLWLARNVEILGQAGMVQVKHVLWATKSDLVSLHHGGGLDARHGLDFVATRLQAVPSAKKLWDVCQYSR